MSSRWGEVLVLVVGRGTLTVTDDTQTLRGYGVQLTVQTDPLEALVALPMSRPDFVVLPLHLQSVQVDSLIRTITGTRQTRCLIVWCPGEDTAETIERCLDAGASGLLPPRLSARELARGLSSVALPKERRTLLRAGPITLDLNGLTVHHGSARAQLSPTLTALLEVLLRSYPEPVAQAELVTILDLNSTLTLRQTIARLRKRLRGIGVHSNPVAHSRDGCYRLVLTEPAEPEPRRSAAPEHAPTP